MNNILALKRQYHRRLITVGSEYSPLKKIEYDIFVNTNPLMPIELINSSHDPSPLIYRDIFKISARIIYNKIIQKRSSYYQATNFDGGDSVMRAALV